MNVDERVRSRALARARVAVHVLDRVLAVRAHADALDASLVGTWTRRAARALRAPGTHVLALSARVARELAAYAPDDEYASDTDDEGDVAATLAVCATAVCASPASPPPPRAVGVFARRPDEEAELLDAVVACVVTSVRGGDTGRDAYATFARARDTLAAVYVAAAYAAVSTRASEYERALAHAHRLRAPVCVYASPALARALLDDVRTLVELASTSAGTASARTLRLVYVVSAWQRELGDALPRARIAHVVCARAPDVHALDAFALVVATALVWRAHTPLRASARRRVFAAAVAGVALERARSGTNAEAHWEETRAFMAAFDAHWPEPVAATTVSAPSARHWLPDASSRADVHFADAAHALLAALTAPCAHIAPALVAAAGALVAATTVERLTAVAPHVVATSALAWAWLGVAPALGVALLAGTAAARAQRGVRLDVLRRAYTSALDTELRRALERATSRTLSVAEVLVRATGAREWVALVEATSAYDAVLGLPNAPVLVAA